MNFDQRQMVMETKEYYLNDKYKSKLDTYRDYMRDILWTMIEGLFFEVNKPLNFNISMMNPIVLEKSWRMLLKSTLNLTNN